MTLDEIKHAIITLSHEDRQSLRQYLDYPETTKALYRQRFAASSPQQQREMHETLVDTRRQVESWKPFDRELFFQALDDFRAAFTQQEREEFALSLNGQTHEQSVPA